MKQKPLLVLFIFFFAIFGFATSTVYGIGSSSSLELSNIGMPHSMSSLSNADTGNPDRKDPILPIVLNIIPGFGIGSFVLGDVWGGVLGVGGELVGIGLIITGTVLFYYDLVSATLHALVGDRKEDISAGFIMVLCGGILYGGTKIFGIIKPIFFADEYNKRNLSDGTKQLSLSVRPIFSSSTEGSLFQPGIQARLSY